MDTGATALCLDTAIRAWVQKTQIAVRIERCHVTTPVNATPSEVMN
jgi:hypothetical protein